MHRIPVTAPLNTFDDDAPQRVGWFDRDRATTYKDGTRWDGSNKIGMNSGSQWVSEWLYRTAGGRWVLNTDSTGYQGGEDIYRFVGDDEARDWLIRTEDHEDALREHFPDLADEVGPISPGRPPVGPQVVIRMPADLRDRIDAAADAEGVTRADWARRALESALGKR
jgi:hypothetical protein